MKIAVIGANGKTGRIFVRLALKAGHQVTAGVHSKNSLSPQSNLRILPSDTTQPEQVDKLLKNQDAVVSFIGHNRHSPDHIQTETINNVIATMSKYGIKRLVSLTGTGVRLPGDNITLIDRCLNLSIGLIDPKRIQDGIDHVTAIQESTLDWTVLRVLKLTNGRPRPYSLKDSGPSKVFISRTEVAQAALKLLINQNHIRSAPMIAKP